MMGSNAAMLSYCLPAVLSFSWADFLHSLPSGVVRKILGEHQQISSNNRHPFHLFEHQNLQAVQKVEHCLFSLEQEEQTPIYRLPRPHILLISLEYRRRHFPRMLYASKLQVETTMSEDE